MSIFRAIGSIVAEYSSYTDYVTCLESTLSRLDSKPLSFCINIRATEFDSRNLICVVVNLNRADFHTGCAGDRYTDFTSPVVDSSHFRLRNFGNSYIEIAAKLSPVSFVVRLEIDSYITCVSSVNHVVVTTGIPSSDITIQIVNYLELVILCQCGLEHELCRVSRVSNKFVTFSSTPAVHCTSEVETILQNSSKSNTSYFTGRPLLCITQFKRVVTSVSKSKHAIQSDFTSSPSFSFRLSKRSHKCFAIIEIENELMATFYTIQSTFYLASLGYVNIPRSGTVVLVMTTVSIEFVILIFPNSTLKVSFLSGKNIRFSKVHIRNNRSNNGNSACSRLFTS